MSETWAYTAHGRLSNHDQWDWFGPSPHTSLFEAKLYSKGRQEIIDLRKKAGHVIGFDGKHWIVGQVALPETFLDNDKYPPNIYNYANGTRPVHFLHGYQSASGEFPERIPVLDQHTMAELHEKNIIPLWDRSVQDPHRIYKMAGRTATSFELLSQSVNIADHLPSEAIEELRRAGAERKPIAVLYDPKEEQWSRIAAFERENDLERLSREAREATIKTIPDTPTVEREVEQIGRSFRNIHPVGKIAIIGGSVALLSLIGYWVFRTGQHTNGLATGRLR